MCKSPINKRHKKYALCNVYRRRVRASTRLIEAAKALATRDYVRGISRLSALSNTYTKGDTYFAISKITSKRVKSLTRAAAIYNVS
jgi:hypothetical protein